MKSSKLACVFGDFIPSEKQEGKLYISINCKVAVHLCPCGCGSKVVTPLSKKHGWVLSYDGQKASLSPSIAVGACPKKAHYWICENEILWARPRDESYDPIRQSNIRNKLAVWWKRFRV